MTLLSTRRGFGLALAGCLARPAAATPGEVAVGQLLPPAPMQGLNGPSRNLSSYRGKPLLINVWASWCGPCRAEMASLERLAWGATGQRLAIIGISTDDHVVAAQAWLKRSNATISHFIDHQLALENLLGASRLPLTVLVDAEGRVRAKVYGAQEWDEPALVKQVEQTLGLRAGAPKRP
jgi:thiol-disulfide isomerase/thioredoxin